MSRQADRHAARRKANQHVAIWLSGLVVVIIGLVALLVWGSGNTNDQASLVASQSTTSSTGATTSPESSQASASQTSGQDPQAGQEVVGPDGVTRVDGIVIVNKKHPLPADYAPGEDPTAKEHLLELIADMQAKGYPISNQYSGYRSYQYQVQLYNDYVARDGQAEADRYSARPGYSEHQTGLAFDIIDTAGNLLGDGGGNDAAVAYLAENAHRFGFIVRFTPDGEASTGYMREAWHLRYIGDKATDIYESGKTLEEYLGVEGGDYAD